MGGALIIVLCLLGLNLRLVFPALLGWLQIVLCFPLAFLLYYTLFNSSHATGSNPVH